MVQFIFSYQYLPVSLQAGRVLSLLPHQVHEVLLLVCLHQLHVQGHLGPHIRLPTRLSVVVRHLIYRLGSKGASLNQLEFGEPVGEDPCTTSITCTLSDNSLITRYLGYHPTTTTTLSMTVLTFLYTALVGAELLIGTRGNSCRFAKIKRKKEKGKA